MSNTPNDASDLTPLDLDLTDDAGAAGGDKSIRAIGSGSGILNKTQWKRTPNKDGTGATHVKTFFCKLRADAIEFMDEQINQYLDQHPECEVKFVTTSVGAMLGKTTEPALFINLWI